MIIQHEDKIINTNNVSNISIEGDKFIFNMNYSVSLSDNIDKHIPDYVYFVCREKDEYEDMLSLIENLNWISSDFGSYKRGEFKPNKRIINPKCVSFIKLESWKPRIIFNLNTSISFYRNDFEKTSDFIFYDYENIEDYEEDLKKIKHKLEVEG